jgi:uncharacterized protein YbcI
LNEEQGDGSPRAAKVQQSVVAEIAREMVRLYKDQFGRGPTKAKVNFAGPDIVICTLENSLTPVEHRLAALGEDQRLRDTRSFFQHVTRDQFCAVIEQALGRQVRAFVSGLDTKVDVASEVFYLRPQAPFESTT